MTDETERDRRDEEDAALIIALLSVAVEPPPVAASSRALWGDPARILRQPAPSRTGWWASGQPG